ncbi:MAG: HEAT repeat domain-containing protein [Nitrospirota bacterium]|nr:HEAT repeat domain-containing protein [Nitrospirota bacterium]
MNDAEMQAMLIEYMGKGFLENIVALFKQEPGLMRFIPALIADEQVVVRLGATALVEELAGGFRLQLRTAVPGLVSLLEHENPTIRGDAVNLLGIIGDPSAREALRRLEGDAHAAVRLLAKEALQELDQ